MAASDRDGPAARAAPPGALKRYVDQRWLPAAINAAAWCDARVFDAGRGVARAPLRSLFAAVVFGMALAVRVGPRRRA